MTRLVLTSWLLLLRFEMLLRMHDFQRLHAFVLHEPVRSVAPQGAIPAATLCHAMDLACVFYFKQVLCLQRSTATTVLLRRHGLSATMCIGAQMLPLRSHAWVEIADTVVNDKPYMREIYHLLDRC